MKEEEEADKGAGEGGGERHTYPGFWHTTGKHKSIVCFGLTLCGVFTTCFVAPHPPHPPVTMVGIDPSECVTLPLMRGRLGGATYQLIFVLVQFDRVTQLHNILMVVKENVFLLVVISRLHGPTRNYRKS